MYAMNTQKTGTKRGRGVLPLLPSCWRRSSWTFCCGCLSNPSRDSSPSARRWRAIISDSVFIRTHLRWSSSKWEQDPSFIISPHTLDIVTVGERWADTFSNHIKFYQWKQRAAMAAFVHAKDFGREFNSVHYFTHCDGLVLAPTDTKLYLFNPATRVAVTLPASRHTYPLLGDKGRCYSAGLGLDPRTGKYKVFRSFFRDPRIDTHQMGMEVFTVGDGGGAWRELVDDLPFPIKQWKSGICINGFLFLVPRQ
ncbi:hypothetical protein ACP70R_029077 [Stipagrostis hirtigluma subsp. patula]